MVGRGYTATVKVCVALMLGLPLSVTMMPIALVAGAVVGVQLNRPLPELMLALPGAPAPRLKVRVWGGWSVSVALGKKVKVWPRVTNRLVRTASAVAALGTSLLGWFTLVCLRTKTAHP